MSGKTFVFSDPHFGHLKMALKRGFESIEEHDQFLIENWNRVVRKGDTVWILGDITMEKKAFYYILGKLNGVKRVVGGNHDKPKPSHTEELLKYVNTIVGCYIDKKKRMVMTHIPIHPSQFEHKYDVNIHGHVHDEPIDDERYFNVSAEAIDYTPILLEDILSKYAVIDVCNP